MGRHFRFLLILLCYGLLPAILVVEGSRAWLEQRRDSHVQSLRDELHSVVHGLREDIIRQRPRDRMVYGIRDSLGKIPEFTAEAVDALQEKFERDYPGMIRMICLTSPELNHWDGQGRKVPGDFVLLGQEKLKYRFLYQTMARLVDLKSNRNEGAATAMKSRSKLLKKIIGEQTDPYYVASRRCSFQPITHEDRRAWFFWDYIEGDVEEQGRRRAILFCYVFQKEYQEYFGPEGLLARAQKEHPSQVLGLLDRRSSAEVALLDRKWPGFSAVVASARRSQEELRNDHFLIVVSPVGSGDRRVFYTVAQIRGFNQELQGSLRRIQLVVAVCLLIFGLIVWRLHYGRLRMYISIRFQLAALFLLAALIPLCAIFYLGYQHVMKSQVDLREDHVNLIRNQVRSVDDVMADGKQGMLGLGMELLASDSVKAVCRGPLNADLKTKYSHEIQRHFGVRDDRGLNKDGLLEDVLIFDLTGEVILSVMTRPRGFLQDIMSGMSRDLLREVCRDKGIQYHVPEKAKLMGSLLKSMDSPIEMAIMRNRGVIHNLDILGERITFMFEPVFDGQEPLGTMMVIFDINGFAKRALGDLVMANDRECRNARTAGQRFVSFVSGHVSFEYRKYPSRLRFTDSLNDFFRAIVADGMPREGTVQLCWDDGSEETMLAWGAPLKEIKDYILIGMTPERYVNEEYGRKLRFYILVFLLAVLVALAIALVISVKFIHPVKLVQKGVRAITEGDLEYRMRIDSRDELGDLAQIFNRMVAGLQEKERMSRYVSEFVLDEVKKERDDGEGEEKKATILFADIRGFTALSESHPPAVIVRMLNEYLELMTAVIRRNGGVVDKFIGDAIMAVFYPDHPKGAREDEIRAVITALQMRDELSRFNAERKMLGWFEIENGIGINTGDVISGNIGARDYRVDFTVIGDHVNIAARLESASKEGKHTRIVISERTWQAVRTLIEAERMEATRVKGKSHDVVMYEVVSLRRLEDYLPMLEAPDGATRVQGLRLAAVLDDPALIEHAATLIRSGEMAVRHEAAFALGRFPGNPRVGTILMEALDRESDETVRATLIKLVGEVGRDEDRIAMQRYLGDESPRVRANAIEAIGRARDRAAVIDTLCGFVNDPNNRIRANACVMLWSLGDTSGLDILMAMTRRPEELMRASGAWGIGEIATREKIAELRLAGGTSEELISPEFFAQLDAAVECLHHLLDDPDLMVQRNAIKGLGKVGNRRSVHQLIRKYQDCTDDEIRMMTLAALDEIGSYHIVRQLREEKRG